MTNIVEAVKNELTGDLLEKLAASTGGSVDSVKSAANAATPSLLSVLAGLASGRQGADALVAALRGFETESPERLRTDVLEGRGDDLQRRGGGVLNSLLGGTLPSLIKILAQFENINPELVKKVLGYLAPLVLSTIAGQLKSRGGISATGLTNFFTEQKANIGGAIPHGLSMVGLPTPPQHQPSAATGQSNPWYWLAPLLVLGAIGLLIWFAFLRTPPPPPIDVDRTTTTPVPREEQPVAPSDAEAKREAAARSNNDATTPSAEPPREAPPTANEVIRSLGNAHVLAIQAIASVQNAETAEAQLPALNDLGPLFDEIKAQWDQLADADKKTVAKATAENRDAFKTLAEKALQTPEIAEKLKDALDALVAKVDQFAG